MWSCPFVRRWCDDVRWPKDDNEHVTNLITNLSPAILEALHELDELVPWNVSQFANVAKQCASLQTTPRHADRNRNNNLQQSGHIDLAGNLSQAVHTRAGIRKECMQYVGEGRHAEVVVVGVNRLTKRTLKELARVATLRLLLAPVALQSVR